jgi:hypothetical protein
MEKSSVYIETTIISYLATRPSRDLIVAAHQQITQEWWENKRKEFRLFASQLVIQEATRGDEEAVQRRLEVLEGIPSLQISEAAVGLAKALIKDHALPEKALGDALHIGIATVHGMDYLITWNLKHLANAAIRNAISGTCRAYDYEPVIICTPEELPED